MSFRLVVRAAAGRCSREQGMLQIRESGAFAFLQTVVPCRPEFVEIFDLRGCSADTISSAETRSHRSKRATWSLQDSAESGAGRRAIVGVDLLEENVGSDQTFLRQRASAGAVGSMQAVWKDQRETEPSVTGS